MQRWRTALPAWARLVAFFASSLACAAQLPDTGVTYRLVAAQPLARFTASQRSLLQKLNRADEAHLGGLKRIVVPSRWDLDELAYSPMPGSIPQLTGEPQALVVDIPAQVFGAYEFGALVRWGPVSSGAPGRQTPAGQYYLNWNARVHISSKNESWVMPWYFNFDNESGYGLHEYDLPGRPASHGCVRLLRTDAEWIYSWGRGWTLAPESGEVLRQGTPVMVVGRYDFASPRPWLRPAWWASGVKFPESDFTDR